MHTMLGEKTVTLTLWNGSPWEVRERDVPRAREVIADTKRRNTAREEAGLRLSLAAERTQTSTAELELAAIRRERGRLVLSQRASSSGKSALVLDAERRARRARGDLGFSQDETASGPKTTLVLDAERRNRPAGRQSTLALAQGTAHRTVSLAEDAARRARRAAGQDDTLALSEDEAVIRPPRTATTAGDEANLVYVQWILDARRKLAKWTPDGGEPPITDADLREAEATAIKRGANRQLVESLGLAEPANALAQDAEQRLIESIIGPGKV
jgi:hypothetical protein